jgi:hypothetical protein
VRTDSLEPALISPAFSPYVAVFHRKIYSALPSDIRAWPKNDLRLDRLRISTFFIGQPSVSTRSRQSAAISIPFETCRLKSNRCRIRGALPRPSSQG